MLMSRSTGSRTRCATATPASASPSGAETDGVEPDASEYRCDECGEPKVFGAEELLLRNLLHDEPATAG